MIIITLRNLKGTKTFRKITILSPGVPLRFREIFFQNCHFVPSRFRVEFRVVIVMKPEHGNEIDKRINFGDKYLRQFFFKFRMAIRTIQGIKKNPAEY